MAGSNSAVNTGFGLSGILTSNGAGVPPTFSDSPTITSTVLSGGTSLGTYVQSTFTPALTFGNLSVGITYTTQSGEYTQIGNVVFFTVQIVLSSKGSSTGSARISLPITPGTNISSFPFGRYVGITPPTARTQAGAYMLNSQAALQLVGWSSLVSTTALLDTSFTNTAQIYISGFYFTS